MINMAVMHENIHVPNWWYQNRRPPNDNAYFENLCRVIFQTGLNWHVVDKKWATIKPAFCNFDVNKIAKFTDADVKQLLNDKGIIRNIYKINAIIENAKQFRQIAKKCGSFQAYLGSLNKSNNYAKVVKELAGTFKRIGPTTASLFLLSVGERIVPSRMY